MLNYHHQFNIKDPVEKYNKMKPTQKFHIWNSWIQMGIQVNATEEDLQHHLNKLNKEFDLVLITEQFDLSLLLLRRKLCWDISDMLYIPLKKASYVFNKNLMKYATENGTISKQYENSNPNAYKFYNYFNKSFSNLVFQQGPDLQDELLLFLELKRNITTFCSKYINHILHNSSSFLNAVNNSDILTISASKWGKSRTVSPIDCAVMHLHKYTFHKISVLKEKGMQFIRRNIDKRRLSWLNVLSQPIDLKFGFPLPVLTHAQAYDVLPDTI